MAFSLFAMAELFKQIVDFDFTLFGIFGSYLARAMEESSLSSTDDDVEKTLAVEKAPNEFRFGVLDTGCFECNENGDDGGVARDSNKLVGDADTGRCRR